MNQSKTEINMLITDRHWCW